MVISWKTPELSISTKIINPSPTEVLTIMLRRTFPSPEALRRLPFGLADVALILGTLVLLGL
ncbi:hypothetical protein, partial [Fischerella thermalis]